LTTATAQVERGNDSRWESLRTWGPLVGVATVTLIVYATCLASLKPLVGTHSWMWPVVALAEWFAVFESYPIRTRTFSTHLIADGVALMLGVAFLSPLGALTAVSLGMFVGNLQHPRSMAKKLNATLMAAFSLAVAILVYRALLGSKWPVHIGGWGPVAAALAVYSLIDAVGVVTYVAYAPRRTRRAPLKPICAHVALEIVLNSAASILAITLIWSNNLATLIMSVALAGMTFGRKGLARALWQDKAIKEVLRYIKYMCGSKGTAEQLIADVLNEACEVTLASKASLVAPLRRPEDGLVLRWTLAGEGPLRTKTVEMGEGLAALALQRGALTLSRSDRDPLIRHALEADGVREAIVVPLSPTGALPGYLMVGDRPYAHEGFTSDEVKLVQNIAANAELVLRRRGIMDRLHEESTARIHEARHDSLTGLPNRASFSQHLDQIIREAEEGTNVGLLLVDLDNFKQVNETLGFEVGDTLLAEAASRLSPFKQEGFVARLGGDEFALVLRDVAGEEECVAKAQEMIAAIARPMAVDNFDLVIGASAGVVAEPALQTTASRMLRKADVALYRAKAFGLGVSRYDVSSDNSSLRRLSLATELRRAIEANELKLHYQPVVELASGEVTGFEALLRWSHEQFGPVSPEEFIPVAERSGLIDLLTWWAIDEALHQLKAWRKVAPELRVAVNLSPRTLSSPELTSQVMRSLARWGLEPDALRLELTETSVADDSGREKLEELKSLGVHLSIDDFGTGYSSLARLRDMPFDEVKIDRSFVRHMCDDREDEAVVRSVIRMARGLDKFVTAEGVEDLRTLERLAELGCHSVQGYFLSKPVPAEQCEALLHAAPFYVAGIPRRVPDLAATTSAQGVGRRMGFE
jgi:diguanylate cyclase (GGDEF)-like protein